MTQEIVLKDPTSLHEHPRNQEFFDDIVGSKWDEFKTSIAQMGVMTPLIVTENNTVISGWQRTRAALELAWKMCPASSGSSKTRTKFSAASLRPTSASAGASTPTTVLNAASYNKIPRSFKLQGIFIRVVISCSRPAYSAAPSVTLPSISMM